MHSVLRRVVKGVPPTDRYTTSSSGRRRRAHACHALTVSTSAPVAAAAAQVRLAVAIPLWLAHQSAIDVLTSLYVDCLNTTASRTHMAHQQRGCTPVRDHLMLPHQSSNHGAAGMWRALRTTRVARARISTPRLVVTQLAARAYSVKGRPSRTIAMQTGAYATSRHTHTHRKRQLLGAYCGSFCANPKLKTCRFALGPKNVHQPWALAP